MTFLLIALIVIFLFAAVGYSPLVLYTSYKENIFSFSVSFLGFRILDNSKKNKSGKEKGKKKSEKETDIVGLITELYSDIIDDLKDIFSKLGKKIICDRFLVDLHFSCRDAALTGETCGLLWSITGLLLPVLDTGLSFKNNPEINITPHFENPLFVLVYEGIYKVRICHIIYMGIHVLKKFKKYKGGVKNG